MVVAYGILNYLAAMTILGHSQYFIAFLMLFVHIEGFAIHLKKKSVVL